VTRALTPVAALTYASGGRQKLCIGCAKGNDRAASDPAPLQRRQRHGLRSDSGKQCPVRERENVNAVKRVGNRFAQLTPLTPAGPRRLPRFSLY